MSFGAPGNIKILLTVPSNEFKYDLLVLIVTWFKSCIEAKPMIFAERPFSNMSLITKEFSREPNSSILTPILLGYLDLLPRFSKSRNTNDAREFANSLDPDKKDITNTY